MQMPSDKSSSSPHHGLVKDSPTCPPSPPGAFVLSRWIPFDVWPRIAVHLSTVADQNSFQQVCLAAYSAVALIHAPRLRQLCHYFHPCTFAIPHNLIDKVLTLHVVPPRGDSLILFLDDSDSGNGVDLAWLHPSRFKRIALGLDAVPASTVSNIAFSPDASRLAFLVTLAHGTLVPEDSDPLHRLRGWERSTQMRGAMYDIVYDPCEDCTVQVIDLQRDCVGLPDNLVLHTFSHVFVPEYGFDMVWRFGEDNALELAFAAMLHSAAGAATYLVRWRNLFSRSVPNFVFMACIDGASTELLHDKRRAMLSFESTKCTSRIEIAHDAKHVFFDTLSKFGILRFDQVVDAATSKVTRADLPNNPISHVGRSASTPRRLRSVKHELDLLSDGPSDCGAFAFATADTGPAFHPGSNFGASASSASAAWAGGVLGMSPSDIVSEAEATAAALAAMPSASVPGASSWSSSPSSTGPNPFYMGNEDSECAMRRALSQLNVGILRESRSARQLSVSRRLRASDDTTRVSRMSPDGNLLCSVVCAGRPTIPLNGRELTRHVEMRCSHSGRLIYRRLLARGLWENGSVRHLRIPFEKSAEVAQMAMTFSADSNLVVLWDLHCWRMLMVASLRLPLVIDSKTGGIIQDFARLEGNVAYEQLQLGPDGLTVYGTRLCEGRVVMDAIDVVGGYVVKTVVISGEDMYPRWLAGHAVFLGQDGTVRTVSRGWVDVLWATTRGSLGCGWRRQARVSPRNFQGGGPAPLLDGS